MQRHQIWTLETEDEMVVWHHRLNGHEFEQTPGDEGQGSLACCSSLGCKESDTTEHLNSNNQRLNIWPPSSNSYAEN